VSRLERALREGPDREVAAALAEFELAGAPFPEVLDWARCAGLPIASHWLTRSARPRPPILPTRPSWPGSCPRPVPHWAIRAHRGARLGCTRALGAPYGALGTAS
jgi:hypothetical protein